MDTFFGIIRSEITEEEPKMTLMLLFFTLILVMFALEGRRGKRRAQAAREKKFSQNATFCRSQSYSR